MRDGGKTGDHEGRPYGGWERRDGNGLVRVRGREKMGPRIREDTGAEDINGES